MYSTVCTIPMCLIISRGSWFLSWKALRVDLAGAWGYFLFEEGL